MGALTTVYMYHPRGCIFKQDYLAHMIAMDKNKGVTTGLPEYGMHKVIMHNYPSYFIKLAK